MTGIGQPAGRRTTGLPTALRWSLITEATGRPGHENMGIDYALLHRAAPGTGFLRLYAWNPACLSFGRNEPARRRYDRDAIQRLGLATVRRPTGGRAVWHDGELTYAVAAPCEAFGTLRQAYLTIHDMLAAALRVGFGIDAGLADPHRPMTPVGAGACFASPAGGEVVVRGRKLVGSAQVREGASFLQHGSILLHGTQDMVSRVTRGPAPPSAAISLAALVDRPVSFVAVADAVRDSAMKRWPGVWQENLSSTYDPRGFSFEDPGWTWQK